MVWMRATTAGVATAGDTGARGIPSRSASSGHASTCPAATARNVDTVTRARRAAASLTSMSATCMTHIVPTVAHYTQPVAHNPRNNAVSWENAADLRAK